MVWLAIYLLMGLIIGLLHTIFVDNIKGKFQKVNSEVVEGLVGESGLDKGEYGERVVYSPRPDSDVFSRAALETREDIAQKSEGSLAVLLILGFTFFWGPTLLSWAYKFVKKMVS